jgi:hypothetical protein
MKLRLAVLGIFLALCITPAVAVSFDFQNQGLVSSSTSGNGISVSSFLGQVSLGGIVLIPGPGPNGFVNFDTGALTTGSLLGGGQFGGGAFEITLNGSGSILFASNFSGTWSQVSHDIYELIGTFSTTVQGLNINGFTKQFFEVEREDGQLSFEDLHGTTSVSPVSVPEPGTLTLLGTGLLGLGGMVRRKFASV